MQQFQKSYTVFCKNVIEERIIGNQEILRMTKLVQLFCKTVKIEDGCDLKSYRYVIMRSWMLIHILIFCIISQLAAAGCPYVNYAQATVEK